MERRLRKSVIGGASTDVMATLHPTPTIRRHTATIRLLLHTPVYGYQPYPPAYAYSPPLYDQAPPPTEGGSYPSPEGGYGDYPPAAQDYAPADGEAGDYPANGS